MMLGCNDAVSGTQTAPASIESACVSLRSFTHCHQTVIPDAAQVWHLAHLGAKAGVSVLTFGTAAGLICVTGRTRGEISPLFISTAAAYLSHLTHLTCRAAVMG